MIFGYLIGKMSRENSPRHYDVEPITLSGLLKALALIAIGMIACIGIFDLVVVLANRGGLVSSITWSVLCFIPCFIGSLIIVATLKEIRVSYVFRNYDTESSFEVLEWWDSLKVRIGFWTVVVVTALVGTFLIMRG